MPNESFFKALKEGYNNYDRSEKSKFSWSQETTSTETKNFIINSALATFNTTDTPPTAAQMSQMAIALFTYCMARNREQNGSVSSGNLLYTAILQQLLNSKNSVNETNNQTEQADFIAALIKAMTDYLNTDPSSIRYTHLWIADVNQVLDILLPPNQVNNYKIKIFTESNLIIQMHGVLPLGEKKLFLSYPIIKATLQNSQGLNLGFSILQNLRTRVDSSEFYEAWAQLLFLKGVSIDAQFNGAHFMQTWHSNIYGEGIVTRLNRLLKDTAFAKIDTATQGTLLSLASHSLSATSRSSLQELTLHYGLVSSLQEVDALIVTLLEKNVTLLHETDPLWIEPLIENAKDVESYRKILNKIPDSMLHDFYKRGLHVKLAKKLAEKIQSDPEDFWTQTQDKKVDRYPILNETIQKIIAQRGSELMSTHAALDVVNDYNRKYTEFKAYTTAKAPNNVTASAPDNFTPILTAIQTIKSNQRAAGNADDFLSVQCQILNDNNGINYQHWQLISTYLVTNIIGTPLPDGQNNNLMHDFEEADKTSDSKSFMHGLITQHNSLVLDDYYKKEISLCVQKALTRWLVNNFPLYNAATNRHTLIDNFIIFNKNLDYVLRAFNLDYNAIVLNNPISKSILTDTCKTLLAFSTLAEKSRLANLKFYFNITITTEATEDPFTLLGTLQEQADSYLSIVSGANHYAKRIIGGNKTNLLYATFIQKTKENKEKSILTPVTVIMSILDFIITSHTSEKFQKEFYEEYLRKTLQDNTEILKLLAPYTDFFIAQINLSLKKLEPAHYKDPARAQNLYEVLLSLMTNFSIKISDLDAQSQTIIAALSIPVFFTNLEIDSKDAITIRNSFINYYQNLQITPEFVKNIIFALLKYNHIKGFHLLMVAHSLVFKHTRESSFIITALKYKDDTFNSFEFLLEAMTQYPAYFKKIWLLCLQLGYQPTAAEFKGKPLISYLAVSHTSNETLDNIESLFKNEYFNNLAVALKSEILSTACVSSPTPLKSSYTLDCNGDITSTQKLFTTDFSKGSSSETFNPNLWSPAYNTAVPVTAETQFTPLVRLTFSIGKSDADTTSSLEQIVNILKVNPVLDQEDSQQGYWIEHLLPKALFISEKNKKTIIDTVYPYIPQKMWEDFFEKKVLQGMLDKLNNHTDPLTDAPADHTTYGLYVRLLLEATFRCPEKAMAIDKFIGTLCKHQLFYPETETYLTAKLNESSVNPALKQNITQARAKAASIRTGILGVKNKAEPAFKNATVVCSMVKEFLFLPLSIFTNDNINCTPSLDFTVEEDAHAAIYVSIEKSINHTLIFASEKWQSYAFVMGFLKFMSSLATTLKLDPQKLLPQACLDNIIACILWKQKYSDNTNTLSNIENFDFVFKKVADKFKELHDYTQEHAARYDTFMTTIIKNTENYQAQTLTNPFTQTANKECAAFIVARNQYGTALLGSPEGKNIAFIKTLTKIIHYRIQGYARPDYEKGLYTTSLRAPLELLKTQSENLPEFYQKQFYIEIKSALQTMLKDNAQTFDEARSNSLKRTIVLFSTICGLDEAQQKNLNEMVPAAVSSGIYASYNHSQLSGSNYSPYTSGGLYTGYYGGYGFGGGF